jgi:hypothetical protein
MEQSMIWGIIEASAREAMAPPAQVAALTLP